MAITGAGLQPIYDRLNAAPAYHPLEADTFADWSLEAGDIVTVSRDGTDYASPVHKATHVWKGQTSARISSGGDERRESIARVSRKKYNSGGSGVRSGEYVKLAIADAYNGLGMFIIQTASVWQTNLVDAYNGLSSSVTQTASMWQANLNDAYNGLSSTVTQTASKWEANLNDAYNGLSSTVTQTASKWQASLNDAYNGLSSTVTQTASKWEANLNDAYNGLSSTVVQTASKWEASLNDAYNGLSSTVTQTASKWEASLSDAYNGLSSTVTQTASEWQASLSDAYNGLSSTVTQTASSWNSKITSNYNNLVSLVEQTASSWSAKVSGVVDEDGNVTAASIAIAINEGGSEANISADQINLDGRVALSDCFTVDEDSRLHVSKRTDFADDVVIGERGSIIIQGQSQSQWTLDSSSVSEMIIKAAVSGNTLKLWKMGEDTSQDPSITFSKATTLSGAWSGRGKLTVTASPQNVYLYRRLYHDDPYEDQDGNIILPIGAYDGESGTSSGGLTGYDIHLENYLDNSYDGTTSAKKITSNNTYTPASGKVGFSKVVVNVPATTPTLSDSWNENTYTVSSSPAASGGNKSVTLNIRTNGNATVDSLVANAISVPVKLVSGTTTETDRWSKDLTVAVGSLLKTQTFTSNGSQTLGDGYIGWGSVTVSVQPTLSGDWSGDTLTVSSSPAASSNFQVTFNTSSTSTTGKDVIELTGNGSPSVSETDGYIDVPIKAQKIYASSVPTVLKSKDISVNVSGLLDDSYDGSTSAKKITSSDTYEPGEGKIGFSKVVVDITPYSSARVTGSWSNNVFTYQRTTSGNKTSDSITVVPIFDSYSQSGTTYFRIAMNSTNSSGTTTGISSGSTTYKLGTSGSTSSTKVQIQDSSGSKLSNTPELSVGSLYTSGWSGCYDTVGISPSTEQTLDYGGSVTVYAQAKSSSSASSKTNVASVKVKAPAGTVTIYPASNQSLGYGGSVTVYARRDGTNIKSIQVTAPADNQSTGWTNCYNTVGISPSTEQTLSYGGSVTVYAQAKSSSGASSKTNVASVKVKAPAGTVTIYPASNQSLGYSDSVTVYARRDGTDIKSIQVTSPADRYETGRNVGKVEGWQLYYDTTSLWDAFWYATYSDTARGFQQGYHYSTIPTRNYSTQSTNWRAWFCWETVLNENSLKMVSSSANVFSSSATLYREFCDITSGGPQPSGMLYYYNYNNGLYHKAAPDGNYYWFRCSSALGTTQDGGSRTIGWG